ncbi:MAG: class I SAM-dependent methyltransferase [Alicyclobacillus sp.]|nr:class I SAM-dependent methyltransferase [Alicyclobacillus sp.]
MTERFPPPDQAAVTAAVQKQFGTAAAAYRDEPLFAEGTDLLELMQRVPLTGCERVLDVGCGTGHTALTLASRAAACVGLDLTREMLDEAEALTRARGFTHVTWVQGDASHLPFADASFDLVTCRFAAHHFAAPAQAVAEVARVLTPGGSFWLIDHYAPEDEELDVFINTLDRLRDPSHVREHRLSEYQQWFAEAGLAYREHLRWHLPLQFDRWVARARTPEPARQALRAWLQGASDRVRAAFALTLDDAGQPLSFCLQCVLLEGRKTHG